MPSPSGLVAFPSQTVGPFFHFGLTSNMLLGCMAHEGALGQRVHLTIRVLDGKGVPVPEAMLELWQADASGKYHHADDTQDKTPDPAFCGFGRSAADSGGVCRFITVRPGRTPGSEGHLQAPHINMHVFAPGIIWQLFTRIYFADDPANAEDAILNLVPVERRGTLLAHPDAHAPDTWNFDVRLSGEHETVFFDT